MIEKSIPVLTIVTISGSREAGKGRERQSLDGEVPFNNLGIPLQHRDSIAAADSS